MAGIPTGRVSSKPSGWRWKRSSTASSSTRFRRSSQPLLSRNLPRQPRVIAYRMLTFFFFSALVIGALTFGAVVFIPLLIIGFVVWLLLLPVRLVLAILFLPFRLLRRMA